MRDLASNIGTVGAIAPAVLTASATSAAIDLQGYRSATFVLSTGAIAGAGDFTAKVQAADTSTAGDFVDVVAADLIGSFPATLAENQTLKVGYIGPRRFVRLVVPRNGGTSIALSAVAIRGHAANRPVA